MHNSQGTSIVETGGRFLMACAVAAAIAGTAMLGGCDSALSRDYGSDGRGQSGHEVDMYLAKSVYQGNYPSDMMQLPTASTQVTEMARVDSPGPGPAVPANDGSASQPLVESVTTIPTGDAIATTMPSGTADENNDIGLSEAALNTNEPVFNMSLQDAIARAMKNALTIKVEAYNPAIKEALVVQAEAAFDPVLFGASQWSSTHEPQLESGTITNGESFQNQVGIRKLLPTGGTAQLSAGDTYRSIDGFNPALVTLKNSNTADVNFTLTQPLLRGFGSEVSEATIYLDRRDYRISLETFRRQVITTAANVEEGYHDLVLARTLVDIDEQLLAATLDTYHRVYQRKDIDADKISVNQAWAAVEARRADLIQARSNLRDQSDKLKNLINDPAISVRDNSLINPTDKPIAEPIAMNIAEQVQTALRERTELQEARLTIEKTDIVLSVAKNDLLPKLDLTASVQGNGLEKGIDTAFADTVNDGHFIDYAAGVKLEIPLGNRAAEGEVQQHTREREQALTNLLAEAQTVVLDVKLQLRAVLSSYRQIQAREVARKSAEDELKAIIDKEQIVSLTPEFLQLKLDSQSRLALAEQDLIQAIVNYNLAIMRLEQAKGTLLEYDRISLSRPPVEDSDADKMRFIGQTYQIK